MAGTNNFLIFDENNINSMADVAYKTDNQRLNGVTTGIARSSLHNKTLRQVSMMVSAMGQVIANSGQDATEDFETLVSQLGSAFSFQYATVNISATDWQNNETYNYVCNKTVTGISAAETAQLIIPVPKLSSLNEFTRCGIYSYAQAANQLSFASRRKPNTSITIYVCYCNLSGN